MLSFKFNNKQVKIMYKKKKNLLTAYFFTASRINSFHSYSEKIFFLKKKKKTQQKLKPQNEAKTGKNKWIPCYKGSQKTF